MTIRTFWRALGGRKNANSYITATLLTIVVFFVAPESYKYYGGYLLAALGITNMAIAFEDTRRPPTEGEAEE